MTAPPTDLDPATTALFLDVDGTLVELQDHPQAVEAEPALLDTLRFTSGRLGDALALVSGRALSDIDRIFAPEAFAAAGAHGSQLRMADGTEFHPPAPALPASVSERVRRFAAEHSGLVVEDKIAGLSLHYRRAPELENSARELIDEILDGLGDAFRLIDGKMVLEVAPRAHCKGAAIRRFLEVEPFLGRRPVFIGDDVTDEDGFAAVNELGGTSIRVGGLTGSVAEHCLPDVPSVHAWIDDVFG